ncbi:hypothetical protein AB0K00_24315 [Dactylosporangium sp. NPDC049525]|uniref:hypothetical protein n=1 Tax=Dactylosporangium sp. NPDC049525 TaxID=3154730 RepID=UPI00341286CD
MRSARMAVAVVVAAGLLGPVQIAHAQEASAAIITMTSDPGDAVGLGQGYELSRAAGDQITFSFRNDGILYMTVQTAGGQQWGLDFSAPAGQQLRPGVYANAVGRGPTAPGVPGMNVSGLGRGCNTLTGSFTIENLVPGPVAYYAPNLNYLQSLDLSFEQHCDGLEPALRGHIHIAEPPAPPITIGIAASRPSPMTAGEEFIITAPTAPAGVTGSLNIIYDGFLRVGGGYSAPNVGTAYVVANAGVHHYVAELVRDDLPARWTSPELIVVTASRTPTLAMTVQPGSGLSAPDSSNRATVTVAVAGVPAEPGELHIYDGNVDLGSGPAVTLAAQETPHQLVAVFVPADPSHPQVTSAIVPYVVRPCACIPVRAQNDTPPYAGSLTLSVAAGTRTTLTQLDPATPAGHPAQATDPTGHRHAWVFSGHLTGVSVTETRPDHPGWILTGQADGFVNGAATLPAANLGWRPAFEADRGDAEGAIVLGAGVASQLADASSPGLGAAAALAGGGGLGTVRLGADLELRMPDTAPTGHYTSVLTLTLISP